VGPDAQVEPPGETPLDGLERVVVRRGGEHEEFAEEPVPFETLRREDPYLEEGSTRVVQEGADGLRRVVYAVRTEGGVPVERVAVADEIVREPASTADPSGPGPHVEQGGATWYQVTPGTCAHRSAPMGTVITVTNNGSGATTTCTVADRGPFASSRILDLSASVFEQLAPLSSGVISVTATW